MNVFKVPDAIESKYHGCGYALAVSVNNELIDIVYLRDVIDDFAGGLSDAKKAIDDSRLEPVVQRLQNVGQVHIGMLSCMEFCEL